MEGASDLENRFRQALLDLSFVNLQVSPLSKCDKPDELRLRGLRVKKQKNDLAVSGQIHRPGHPEEDPVTVTCAGCSKAEDGVDRALGLFLNKTLFNWNWRLLGVFRLESCTRQRSVVFATLKLAERSSISKLESVSYGLAELTRLGGGKVEVLKPAAIFLDLAGPSPGITANNPFDVKFRWREEYTEYELDGFASRYCVKSQVKAQRMLVPVYLVNIDYIREVEEDLLNPAAAPYLWTSSSITPSRSTQK